MGKISVGTCGWSHEDWRGVFYPEHLPASQRLEFYARHFPAVEVDSTFYHPPASRVAAHWREATPAYFRFACKMPREITHDRKLRHAAEPLGQFLEGLRPLAEKLVCVLIQLPPFFTPQHDEVALRDFVRALPGDFRFAIEFRHHDWHSPRIIHLLEEQRVCWVWADATACAQQQEGAFGFFPDTTDFLYVRLMGDLEKDQRREPVAACGLEWPRDPALESWALRLAAGAATHGEVFVATSDQFEGFAPATAERLARRLGIEIKLPAFPDSSSSEPEDSEQLKLW